MARKNEFKLRTRGFKDLLNNFDKIEKAITDNAEEILRSAAEIFLGAAKSKVSVESGDLKESLEIKKLAFEENEIKIGVGPVGEDIFYWFFVEYGTSRMSAKPFLRPAFDENKSRVKAEIRKNLIELVERQGI